jgi:hypothetical protein
MNVEVSNFELDSDVQTVNEGLILGHIVRGGKVESDHIAHVNSEGRDEEQAHTLLLSSSMTRRSTWSTAWP